MAFEMHNEMKHIHRGEGEVRTSQIRLGRKYKNRLFWRSHIPPSHWHVSEGADLAPNLYGTLLR